jgi:hypothetical protein
MIRKDVPTTLLIAVILGAVNAVVNPAKLAELRLQPREGLLSILRMRHSALVFWPSYLSLIAGLAYPLPMAN